MNNIQFVLKTQSCVCTLLLTTLCQVQLVVDSLARHELRVSALLHDTTMVNDDDFVGVLNSRQSVSYHQACTSNLRLVKGFLHHLNSKQRKRCLKLQFPQIRSTLFRLHTSANDVLSLYQFAANKNLLFFCGTVIIIIIIIIINNNNNHDDIYSAVVMTEVIVRVHSVRLVNVEQRQVAAHPQTKPPDLGCESTCFRQLSSTTTVAIYY